MKKLRIILIALAVILVTMFVVNENLAIAAGNTRVLKRQDQRPYSDDDGDETLGNDTYLIQRSKKW